MATTTAEVTTLTAEVRVLMVGSRQVTLSVFRQLDVVADTALEPFGRVNVARRTGEVAPFWIVGRSHRTGNLVRARAQTGQWWETYHGLPLIVLAGLR